MLSACCIGWFTLEWYLVSNPLKSSSGHETPAVRAKTSKCWMDMDGHLNTQTLSNNDITIYVSQNMNMINCSPIEISSMSNCISGFWELYCAPEEMRSKNPVASFLAGTYGSVHA